MKDKKMNKLYYKYWGKAALAFCFLGHHGVPPEQNVSNANYFLKDDISSIEEFYNCTKALFISDNVLQARGL